MGDNRTDDQILIDHFKKNLLHLYNSVTPEYRERARQWYVGANKLSQQAADKYRLYFGAGFWRHGGVVPTKRLVHELRFRHQNNRCLQPRYSRTDIFTKQMASAFRRMIKKQNAGPAEKSHKANSKIINGQGISMN